MDRERILQYCREALYQGDLPAPQGVGATSEPGCGDVMRFGIATSREIITEIGYTITDGACYPARACAAAAARLAKDKPVMEAYLIDKDRIAEELGGLDQENIHCAYMAELTLKRAIVDYVQKREARLRAAPPGPGPSPGT